MRRCCVAVAKLPRIGTIKTTNKPTKPHPNSQRTTLQICAPNIRRTTHISQHSTPMNTQVTAHQRSIPQATHAHPEGVVLHGESSKRLATPRNTKNKKHLQSTQSARLTNLTDQAPSTTVRTSWETHNKVLCSLVNCVPLQKVVSSRPRTLRHTQCYLTSSCMTGT